MNQIIGRYCLVLCNDTSVHVGTLIEWNGKCVLLKDARNLWEWHNAFSLYEASQNGVGSNSRISDSAPLSCLTDVINILPCSDKAKASLDRTLNTDNSQ